MEKLNQQDTIQKIVNRDQLAELTEQDKKFLWNNRQACLQVPNSLNKLLQSFKWSNQYNIIEVIKKIF